MVTVLRSGAVESVFVYDMEMYAMAGSENRYADPRRRAPGCELT